MSKKASHFIEINAAQEQQDKPLSQVERFRRVAQELGCDEDEAAFDEKLKAIVLVGRRNLASAENQVTKPRDESDERSATDRAAK